MHSTVPLFRLVFAHSGSDASEESPWQVLKGRFDKLVQPKEKHKAPATNRRILHYFVEARATGKSEDNNEWCSISTK